MLVMCCAKLDALSNFCVGPTQGPRAALARFDLLCPIAIVHLLKPGTRHIEHC
jgi:hypothetical protein